MSYRRTRGHREWHWFTNCPYWPKENFDPSSTKPPVGEACPHCQQLEFNRNGEWSLHNGHDHARATGHQPVFTSLTSTQDLPSPPA
jgi:hypothetical protein